MKVLNILLFSYLLININAENYFNGTYILSSAWTDGTGEVNCLPTYAKVQMDKFWGYWYPVLSWHIRNETECKDSQLLNFEDKCVFKNYYTVGNYSDVYVCGHVSGASEEDGHRTDQLKVEFFPNNSMIMGYSTVIIGSKEFDDHNNNHDKFPKLVQSFYLFTTNFSSYEEANYTMQANGSLIELEALLDLLDLHTDYELSYEDYQDYEEVNFSVVQTKISSIEDTLGKDLKNNTLNSTYLEEVSEYLQILNNHYNNQSFNISIGNKY